MSERENTPAKPTAEQQKALALSCPQCGAGVGEFCLREGREREALRNRGQVHRQRYMAAARGE
jgi:hypothetical protein